MSTIDTINIDFSSQNINWQPDSNLTSEQKEKIKSGDFGTVESFTTLQDGSLQIKTQYGTLSMSGPELDDVKKDLSVGDFITTGNRLDNFSTNDYMTDLYAVLKLLHETNVERRQADREARHASRDAAMSESLNAAQEIRNGAILGLVMGIASGAINIGMGAFSAVGALKSLGQMKAPIQNFKQAQTNLKTSETNVQLKQQQLELPQARTEVKVKQEVVDTKIATLDKANVEVKTAQEKLNNNTKAIEDKQTEIKQLEQATPRDETKIETAKKDLEGLQTKQTELQKKLDTANIDQTKAQTELDEAQVSLKTSEENVTKLEAQVKETNSKLKKPEDDPTKEISVDEAQKNLKTAKTDYLKAKEASDLANSNLNNKFQELQVKGTFYQSVGQIGSGIANIINAGGQAGEQFSQAKSKEHDAEAQKIQTQGEDITQEMQNEMETINDVKEFFKSMLQSNNQAFQAMLQI